MPKLSLWRGTKTADYKFFDRNISEQFTVGATDLYIHKYIGANNPSNSVDLTQPYYDKTDPSNIQDLLFLENRNRKYDPNIYRLRGHYNVQNLDFDLSQFGLFLTNDIIFVTVHYNDMLDIIGRKLMVGDVFELPHLTDFHPLDETVPIGLRRYYQITDANYASEGFSQTWWPHLWRIKCEPLIDSQEFNDILKQPINKDNYLGDWDPTKEYTIPPGQTYTITFGNKIYEVTNNGTTPLVIPPGTSPDVLGGPWTASREQNIIDILSTYKKNLEINQAVIDEAKRVVPQIGYDRSQLYIVPTYPDGEPAPPLSVIANRLGGPSLTGQIDIITSEQFTRSSNVMRISAEVLSAFGAGAPMAGQLFSLQLTETAPELTDTGSGQVVGDLVLTAQVLGDAITAPYGTADNTYATADQFVNTIATFDRTPIGSRVIPMLQALDNNYSIGLVVRATVFSENGTPQAVWPTTTRIVGIDRLSNSITVDNPTTAEVWEGTPLELAYDFTGTVTPEMDYRADCDPRFQYIRRYSPTSFGYIAGYDSGDGTAPNGEPLQAGIAFPARPRVGDYFLRIDYLPQKLFRWSGALWIEISQKVRTEFGFDTGSQNQLATFINDDRRTPTSDGQSIPTRQSLSNALRIKPD